MFDNHAPTRTVLIVDDEYVPRSLESIALEGTGRYHTLEAGNALDALAALDTQHCDCLIVDQDMPDMSGPELVRMVRRKMHYRDLPVMLVLPDGAADEALAANYPGVNRVIGKPLNPWDLARQIDQLTGADDNSDRVLSIESLLKGFPYPTMVLDADHRVILANGTFYETTGTGIGRCYVHCMHEMHEDRAVPSDCPLKHCIQTGLPCERVIETTLGTMRISVYPLATRAGGRDQLFLHVTQPVVEQADELTADARAAGSRSSGRPA